MEHIENLENLALLHHLLAVLRCQLLAHVERTHLSIPWCEPQLQTKKNRRLPPPFANKQPAH